MEMITCDSHLGLCVLLIDWLSFVGGVRLKLDVQGQGGGRILDVDGLVKIVKTVKIGLLEIFDNST